MLREEQNTLSSISAQFGTLNFSEYSTEVNEACQRFYNDVFNDLSSQHGWSAANAESSRIWSEVVNPQRSEIARTLTQSKRTLLYKATLYCHELV